MSIKTKRIFHLILLSFTCQSSIWAQKNITLDVRSNKSLSIEKQASIESKANWKNYVPFKLGTYYPGKLQGLYGFFDIKKQKVVIQPSCENTLGFSEGLAAVQSKGKWGYIDANGKILISCKYESEKKYYNGFAGVKLNGFWGLIDKNGKQILNCKYENIGDVHFNRLPVDLLVGNWCYIDLTGKELTNSENKYCSRFIGNGYAIVKKSSKDPEEKPLFEIIDTNYNNIINFTTAYPVKSISNFEYFGGGVYRIIFSSGEELTSDFNKNFNCIWDSKSNRIFQFDHVGNCNFGKFVVGSLTGESSYAYLNIIDSNLSIKDGYTKHDNNDISCYRYNNWGQVRRVFENEYLMCNEFSENGIAAVAMGDHIYRYIDTNFNFISEEKFNYARPFINGIGIVENIDKHGFIDVNGKILKNAWFDKASPFDIDGFAVVMLNNNYVLLNQKGEVLKSIESSKLDPRYTHNIMQYFLGYFEVDRFLTGFVVVKDKILSLSDYLKNLQ